MNNWLPPVTLILSIFAFSMLWKEQGVSMANHSKDQLNLFTQPIEVVIDMTCRIKRAAELVGCSEGCLYRRLRQNQHYQRDVPTGQWRVYSLGTKDSTILVKVAFIFSPNEQFWQAA